METILIISLIIVVITIIWVISMYIKTLNYNTNQNNFIIGSVYKSTRPYAVLLIILGIIGLILGYLLFNGITKDPVTLTYDDNGNVIVKDERCPEEQHRENGICLKNIRSAYIENGKGEEHWLGTTRSDTIIMSCDESYVVFNGYCFLIDSLPENIKDNVLNETKPDLPKTCERGIVERVVDGDTIVVNNNKIRLVGIDTPESVDPNKPIEPYAIEASNKIKELVSGKKVCLSPDDKSDKKDKYDRLLRYVYLEDGTFINAELVKIGYARAYTDFPFHFDVWFKSLEKQAQDKNIGLWSE